MSRKPITLEAINRKKALFEQHQEEFLKQRGWTNIMMGWYWVWHKACILKTAGEGEKRWEFNVHHIKDAVSIEGTLYELVYNSTITEIECE